VIIDSALAHHLEREGGHLDGRRLHGPVLLPGDQEEQEVQVGCEKYLMM